MVGIGEYSQQMIGVTAVMDNDIICGRGGLALKHPGNMAYRKIVGLNKELYATCLKTEKLRISKSIVAAIREISGRFLEREDGKTSSSLDEKDEQGNPVSWKDIGDKRAVEKTSQALREGQPKLLKKLAQANGTPSGVGVMQGAGMMNPMMMNGFNPMGGGLPQAQLMPQFAGNVQAIQQNVQAIQLQQQSSFGSFGSQVSQPQLQQQSSFGSFGSQLSQPQQQPVGVQAGCAQHRPSFTAQQRPSITLASLVEGQTFESFPRNSFVENGINNNGVGTAISTAIATAVDQLQGRQDSGHDSWGTENQPQPLSDVNQQRNQHLERSNSTNSRDSWGGEDPMPLPYNEGGTNGHSGDDNLFSSADQAHQLMSALGVEGDTNTVQTNNKRPSVKFHLQQPTRASMSAMSLSSHLSELSISIFSDVLSLDSAMDAAHREAEFEMLGEFDGGEMMSLGTFDSPVYGESNSPQTSKSPRPRRSILRKSNKWTTQVGLPPTALHQHVDPGMIFTSTLDAKPGGVNAGTDISGLLTERRKSVVNFEVDMSRRRSSRMSMCSALTEVSGMFKREMGSTLSIQSADFRELMADIDDDSDDDN